MPIAHLLDLGVARLDRQSLLELATQEDRARRAATKAGRFVAALEHKRERDSLIDQWEKLT